MVDSTCAKTSSQNKDNFLFGVKPKGTAGGGFYENIPRVLPKGVGVDIDVTSWPQLPIFGLLQKWGNVDAKEMYRTFNMGIGMIMIVDEKDADAVLKNLADRDEKAYVIGKVVDSDVPVTLRGGVFHD